MLIDWFTVAAQAVNFLVLVWLLRRLLYGPITRTMAERQRRIDEHWDEADRLRAAATAEREQLRDEAERFAATRDERTRELRAELEALRRAKLREARDEVDELAARWRAAVEREREGFLVELRRRIADQLVDVARRALRDLADEALEARVVERFVERLDGLDTAQRAIFDDAAAADGARVHVRTAFALSPALRTRLGEAVRRTLGGDHDLRFEVAPELVGGVELRAGGQTLEWTFDEYLSSLESALAEALGDHTPEARGAGTGEREARAAGGAPQPVP